MKNVRLALFCVSLVCCAAFASEKLPQFGYEAKSVTVDPDSEEVTVSAMALQFGESSKLIAQSGSYRVGPTPTPRSVELGKVQIQVGEVVVGSAESAIYYPQLGTLSMDAYRVRRAVPSDNEERLGQPGQGALKGGESGTLGVTTYTCQNGSMHENNVAVGPRVCINIYGGGSHTMTCNPDGQSFSLMASDMLCPVE